MGLTLNRIIGNINNLSNKKNSNIIINYHGFLIDKGSAINSQMSHLKALYYYARYLEDKNIIDVKERHEVIAYLNSKIKNDDMEKK